VYEVKDVDEVYVTGHHHPDADAIASAVALAYLVNKIYQIESVPVISNAPDSEVQYALDYFNVSTPTIVSSIANHKVILVDHNEETQAVPGIQEADILAIIDHHQVNLQTSTAVYLAVEPVGATATIIYFKYKRLAITVPVGIAGLLLSAIISDTLLLKGPTTTPFDRIAYQELVAISGVADGQQYGQALLEAGTNAAYQTPTDYINGSVKDYVFNKTHVRIAQVYVTTIATVLQQIDEIKVAMQHQLVTDSCDLFLFVITDILKMDSMVVVIGNSKGVVEQAFNLQLQQDMGDLPGVVSRKKQMVPVLAGAFSECE